MSFFCIPIRGPTFEDIQAQIDEALPFAHFLEWRIDLFHASCFSKLKSLRDSLSVPVIFTLRKHSQGGFFKGREKERLDLMMQLLDLKPDYFDLEYDTPLAFVEKISLFHSSVKKIISYHNFQETPQDLEVILKSMYHLPGDLYKIACQAVTTNDSLRMLDFMSKESSLLGLCMGEKGSLTRILGPMKGAPWTFCALSEEKKIEKGQLSINELSKIYQISTVSSKTALYGLVGGDVSKSISHFIHNKAFQDNGLDALYLNMSVDPENLKEFFFLLKKIGFRGLSVTMPLKESVLPFLNFIDPVAQKMGAVNTILMREGSLYGFNTDGKGATVALEQKMPLEGKKIVIVGAGGAARAIAYEAHRRKAHVLITNRTPKKAEKIAHDLGLETIDFHNFFPEYDILINTTPASLPISEDQIKPQSVIMDIKTIPKKSKLLELAEEKGCELIFGYEMFLNQALEQYKIWFPFTSFDLKKLKTHMLSLLP